MIKKLSLFRCLTCNHTWRAAPGPVTCPRCAALYVQWKGYVDA